jgi:hypothetical protein
LRPNVLLTSTVQLSISQAAKPEVNIPLSKTAATAQALLLFFD